MEWKIPYQIPRNKPYCGMNRSDSITAPAPSKMAVPIMILLASLTIPPICSVFTLSSISPRSFRPILRLSTMERKMPILMNPSPPSWIMISSSTCPNMLHWVHVSATTRPVTQDALVAVNRQLRKGSLCPSLLDMGSIRRKVPVMMIRKNP